MDESHNTMLTRQKEAYLSPSKAGGIWTYGVNSQDINYPGGAQRRKGMMGGLLEVGNVLS